MSCQETPLEARFARLEEEHRAAQEGRNAAVRRLRALAALVFVLLLGALLAAPTQYAAFAQTGNGGDGEGLAKRVSALETALVAETNRAKAAEAALQHNIATIALTAGPQGPAGPAGPKGDTGAKGDAGAPGAQGPQGLKGDTGATGATGPAGIKGDTGVTGAQGPTGTAGATGGKGDPGTPADMARVAVLKPRRGI